MSEFQSFNDFLNEADFSGKLLKSQKLIDLCILVSEKFKTEPDKVREILSDHTMSYDLMKKLSDSINKL